MINRFALFIVFIAVISAGCDCGGGPEFILDEGNLSDIIAIDSTIDAVSDVSTDKGLTDISEDVADVLDIRDVTVDDVEDVKNLEDISDVSEDVEDVLDVKEDVEDISDIKEDAGVESDVIYEDIAVQDVSQDILEDAISDVITDGGITKTTIKECVPSPNNLTTVTFEFTNPDATSFECKLNDSDFVPCTSPVEIPGHLFNALPDGINSFYVRAVINGEPERELAMCSWIKDTTSPETTFAVQPDFDCKDYASLEIECNEANCTYEYSLDGSDWIVSSSTIELTNLLDGTHTIKIRTKDAAGNYDDTPLEYIFTTDTVAPDLTVLNKPNEYTNTNSATFSFASTDFNALFMCSFDQSAFYDCQSPQVFTNLSEGTHNFRVFAKDICENTSAIFGYSFTVDQTPPDSTITSKPRLISNQKNARFEFLCSEDGTAECRIDQNAYSDCTSPLIYNNLSDGEHRFSIRCIDKAKNVDSSPAEYVWKIDTVPPDSTITTKPNNPTQFRNATFEFTCSESGSSECSVDGSAYSTCTSPKTYTNLLDGNHTFSVRCVDEAENVDPTPGSYSWLIDSTPPVTTITEGPQNPTKSTSATFRFSCNENGTIECRLDSQSWAQCTSPKVYINLTNGPHIFSARCTDNVGNVEISPPIYNWVVDTVPPDTSITNYPPSISNSTTASFTFSSTETGSTFECSLNDGAFSPCLMNQGFSGLSEGTNKLCVRATDGAGNTDPTPACYQWMIDITPPNTILISYPSSPTNQTIATFEFDSNESGSTFECSLNNSAYSACTSPKAYTGLSSGQHTFRVRAVDKAGNTDPTPAEFIWQVDTEAPITTIISKPANPSNSTIATFTFSSNDPSSVYECSLDGSAWSPCNSPVVYGGLSEGSHNFRVRAKDQLGNTEQNPPSYNWEIDITPPDTAITTFPPDPTNNPAPQFTFTSNEAGSTFECSYDFGAYFACSTPHTWSNIPEGIRYFSVKAKDKAGNIDPTPAQYSFTVDLTEPNTFIVNKPTNPTKQSSATFSFYSNESDSTFECKINNNNYLPCTSPITYNSLPDGVHIFYVRATDRAGNTDSTPAQYEWKIDTVPPDTNILTNPPSVTNSKNAQFTFSCSDDTLPCTFECSLDGSAFSLCTSPMQYTNLADGNHTFSVRAIDAAQNTDPTPAQYSWRVDTIPPQAFINSMPGNPSITTDATFTFHCNETATTECSLDGSAYTSCTSPRTYSNLSVGTHIFAVRCIDQANNVSVPVQYSWDIMLFRIERVDAPRFFTNFYNRAIKTDSNNIPHIVYGGDNLYHAYLSGTNFVTEIIDNSPGLGEYAALFIDKNDYLHISYYNPTNLSLMYATNSGGVWSKSTIDSGNNVGTYSAIAVDNNGYVHIAYFDSTTSDLKYATNVSGVWATYVVESQFTSGEYCGIAVDSLNNPHITYYKRGFSPNKGVLQYATRIGSAWNIQTLDDMGDGYYLGLFTSIVVDKNDDVHISYYDSSTTDLRYIKRNSGIWGPPIIVESTNDVGRFNSLVVDQNGFVHITYYNNSNATLRYANNLSGSFVTSLVDNSASVGTFNSLAIDKNGTLHTSYYDATNAKVKYAMRLTNGIWTNFRFVDTAGSVGQYPSIHLDTQKRPHVCYYNAFFNGELKYAYKENGGWNISTIDNGGVSNYNVGRYCNIKTDIGNKVHISYLDISRGNIKYITNQPGNWVSENPDNISTVGQFQTGLAVDSNGKIHISYYDSANGGELRYSNNVSGFWFPTVVDNGGAANANVGQFNSIAVDKNGFVHISYYDATNADLKYTTNVSGSFVTYTVDSVGSIGSYTAIALNSYGNPVISYYDAAPNYNLKVAIYDGTSWSISVADAHINNVGQFTSVSVDSNNKIHIAYYDATAFKIKYATNKYGSWQNFIIDTEGRLGTNGFTTGIYATSTGMVHIIYYDFLMRDLKYATNEN